MHQDTHAAAPLLPPARLVGEPQERRDQIHRAIVLRCGVVVNLLAQLGLSRRYT
jgi:hypothetical protein